MDTKKREFIDPNELMRYINEKHSFAGLPMAAHICTMELLTYAPRVDAVEVVHGRWKAHKPDCRGYTAGFICSSCDNIVYTDYCMKECEYNYCPNCGAKMDGERKNNG